MAIYESGWSKDSNWLPIPPLARYMTSTIWPCQVQFCVELGIWPPTSLLSMWWIFPPHRAPRWTNICEIRQLLANGARLPTAHYQRKALSIMCNNQRCKCVFNIPREISLEEGFEHIRGLVDHYGGGKFSPILSNFIHFPLSIFVYFCQF